MIRAVLAVAVTGAAVGCGGTTTTHVAQGEALATGNPAYDDFFTAVRDVRAEALSAPNEEQSSHGALIKALSLQITVTPATVLEEAGQRAKKLQDKGVFMHLEIAPEARLLSSKGRDVGADGEALLKAVEESAKVSLDLRKRLTAVAMRAAELEKQRLNLRDQAAATFRADREAKRDEIIAELDAASPVLADAASAASRSAGDAARFVIDLAQSIETAGGATLELGRLAHGRRPPVMAAAPPAALASKPPPVAAAPPPPHPVAAAPPPPRPAPPPKKPKGGGDDFEP
jgi:hypothetical protein